MITQTSCSLQSSYCEDDISSHVAICCALNLIENTQNKIWERHSNDGEKQEQKQVEIHMSLKVTNLDIYIIPLHVADLRSVVLDWTLSNTINWKTEFLS